ncbi:hypothetical protein L6452_31019 [Arctium lappa]|uniref:Uncharacterized protein n=1 Tax=Arctium lappa TaxID=4217 RepID=A0ACB8ZKP7_ARCLA|nr:hypothetical protein L6452_31019 [Arctium lappa]
MFQNSLHNSLYPPLPPPTLYPHKLQTATLLFRFPFRFLQPDFSISLKFDFFNQISRFQFQIISPSCYYMDTSQRHQC